MKIDQNYLDYLSGKKFSSAAPMPAYTQEDIQQLNRLDYLKEYCKNKKVLHVGCCDHIGLIENKRKAGIYLHDIITECAQKVIGIDIDQDTITYLKTKQNIHNIICMDMTKPVDPQYQEILDEKWDIILLGEVIEHIGNPVSFLSAIHQNFKTIAEELIMTVPNAFNGRSGLKNIHTQGLEIINSDHRFWFTPFTISKIAFDAGFIPTEVKFVWGFPNTIRKPRFNFIKRIKELKFYKYPTLRDGIILHASF